MAEVAGEPISNKKDISVTKVAANSKAIVVMPSPKFRVVETICQILYIILPVSYYNIVHYYYIIVLHYYSID